MSAISGNPEYICSLGVLPPVTPTSIRTPARSIGGGWSEIVMQAGSIRIAAVAVLWFAAPMLFSSLSCLASFVILLLSVTSTATAGDFRSGLSAYNRGDYITAFRDWCTLAEHGDAAAQAGLGFLFHKGLGVIQDDIEAAMWFEKAAAQNQAEAQLLLGTLYFFGKGVQQNYPMAFAWCEIAQSNGQSDALECRDAALEHMTSAEIKQSFRFVTEWLGRHTGPSP